MTDKIDTFSQTDGPQEIEKTLADFFTIQGGVLKLKGILETINFINGKKGVQIRPEGLNSSGGTIAGATISGGTTTSTLVANATGVLYGNGASPVTAISGYTGSFYVASTSGGSPTHLVTVTNGVVVSVS